MAMEDALRIGNDQKGLRHIDHDEDKEETLWRFRPVSTNEFLSSLLCYRGLGQDPDMETSRDNSDGRKDPDANSASISQTYRARIWSNIRKEESGRFKCVEV